MVPQPVERCLTPRRAIDGTATVYGSLENELGHVVPRRASRLRKLARLVAGHDLVSTAGQQQHRSKPPHRRPNSSKPLAKTVFSRVCVCSALRPYLEGTKALSTGKSFPAVVGSHAPSAARVGTYVREPSAVTGQEPITAAGSSARLTSLEAVVPMIPLAPRPVPRAVASKPPALSPAMMIFSGSMSRRFAFARAHRSAAHASSMHPATPVPLFVKRYDADRHTAPCEARKPHMPAPKERSPTMNAPE
eukprot:scaffold130208_cov69-Phaeocystis_antarctica.AAC.6